MPAPDNTFTFGEFLSALAINSSHEQRRLDEDYNRQLQAYAPVLALAHSLGYEQLGRDIAPAALVVQKVELQVKTRIVRSREKEFALRLTPLNLGFSRKHAHSELAQSSMQMTVERVPLLPEK